MKKTTGTIPKFEAGSLENQSRKIVIEKITNGDEVNFTKNEFYGKVR
jgi:hypothetical protein